MIFSNWNITELAAWSTQQNQLKRRLDDLLHPHPGIWPENAQAFPQLAETVLGKLDVKIRPLFLACCLASWLLDQSTAYPEFSEWLDQQSGADELGLPISVEEARQWQWRKSPILLSSEKKGKLVQTLYGVGNTREGMLFPFWADSLMDEEARESVKLAWQLANPAFSGAIFWPILRFTEPECLLHGSSLGLPAYLTFRSMNAPQSEFTIGATGRIDSRGRVLPVEGLEEKYRSARIARMKTFIYPEQEGSRIEEKEPTEPVAVSLLEEAEAVWLHSVPGIANETALLMRSHNTGEFVRRLCRVPGNLLEWLENKNRTVSHALRSQSLNREDLLTLLEQLDEVVKSTPMPSESLEPVLRALDEETVDILADKWPDLAYRVCNHQLRWAGHRGDSEAATIWNQKAEECGKKAAQTGLAMDEIFLEDVLRLVGSLHNRFFFQPDPPQVFLQKMQALEEYFSQLRHFQPKAAFKILGKYYGAMIQNLAFCGPKYLNSVLEYTQKAREAFGNAEQEKDELLRLESYLVFSFLDAGQFDNAEKHLCIYLETDTLAHAPKWETILDPFKHFALIRFIVDTGRSVPDYADWIKQTWEHVKAVHPWQLWLYNSGLLFRTSDPELSYHLFNRSLKICREFGGATVRALALLPLSGLHDISPPEERYHLKSATESILSIIRNSDLNQEHFSVLFEVKDWEEVLRTVRMHSHRLFPFNYR